MEEIHRSMVGFVSQVSGILRKSSERMSETRNIFRGSTLTSLRNRGELAEGWYDPSTKNRAHKSISSYERSDRPADQRRASPSYGVAENLPPAAEDEDSDDDVVGPTVPGHRSSGRRSGPAIPKMDDLESRRGKLFHSLRPLG